MSDGYKKYIVWSGKWITITYRMNCFSLVTCSCAWVYDTNGKLFQCCSCPSRPGHSIKVIIGRYVVQQRRPVCTVYKGSICYWHNTIHFNYLHFCAAVIRRVSRIWNQLSWLSYLKNDYGPYDIKKGQRYQTSSADLLLMQYLRWRQI